MRAAQYGSGLILCAAVAAAGQLLERLQWQVAGRPWLDALVLAILVGALVRTAWTPGGRFEAGISFAAKQVLEVAVALLGLTLDVPLLVRSGPLLVITILVAVAAALGAGYAFGRLFGLRPTVAILVATGNAICGNSAIAAAAPVVRARPEDVASAISFTAVLGVLAVLLLPLLVDVVGLSPYQYGVVAGLTVYAVPQVLAATLPVAPLAGEVGTLVKLTRVLMLGPVIAGLSIWARRRSAAGTGGGGHTGRAPAVSLVPPFVVAFLLAAALRGAGVIPEAAVDLARETSRWLTIVALAALGLGVDIRSLRQAGGAVLAAGASALLFLLGVSILLATTIARG